ncbi:hypothetical protein Taro_054753 [Colocasia esculenta]|uniref:Uncharacterized protein n=1 Tax=Colocasia esculenta TaxID=4460 RepID=A0A843XPQ6_COLES|nr:hypothetical protein [Colocasia esculenta]
MLASLVVVTTSSRTEFPTVLCSRTVLVVDTRPSFQQISLPDWDNRLTLDQVRSTLVPDSRRSGRHTLAGSQKREFRWTHGCLGFRGFDLGFRAHAPQCTLWTYGAINTHAPCTPRAREPKNFQKKPFGGQRGFSRSVSISRSCKPCFQEEGQGNQGESLERSSMAFNFLYTQQKEMAVKARSLEFFFCSLCV